MDKQLIFITQNIFLIIADTVADCAPGALYTDSILLRSSWLLRQRRNTLSDCVARASEQELGLKRKGVDIPDV